MAKIISASIDLSKIDKSKIVSTDKNGQPFQNGAKYLNVQIVVNDEADQYGNDCAVRINQSKEEREAKVKPTYIGNGKTVWSSEANNTTVHQAEVMSPGTQESEDGLPF
jgi:hypothetical protein